MDINDQRRAAGYRVHPLRRKLGPALANEPASPPRPLSDMHLDLYTLMPVKMYTLEVKMSTLKVA